MQNHKQNLFRKTFLLTISVLLIVGAFPANLYANSPEIKPTYSVPPYLSNEDPTGPGTRWSGYINTENRNGWGYQTPYSHDPDLDATEGQRVQFSGSDPFNANDGTSRDYFFARYMFVKVTDIVGNASAWKTRHVLGSNAPNEGHLIGNGLMLVGRPNHQFFGTGRTMFNYSKRNLWSRALNGNEDYVMNNPAVTQHNVRANDFRSAYQSKQNSSDSFSYIRDLAQYSGAYVAVVGGVRQDSTNDGYVDYSLAEVRLTEFPFIVRTQIRQSGQIKGGLDRSGQNGPPSTNTANVTVQKGKAASIELQMSEYAYGTDKISYSYTITGPRSQFGNKSVTATDYNGRTYGTRYIDSILIDSGITNTPGNYVLKVDMKDGVSRPAQTVIINLTVQDENGSVPPPTQPPGGDIGDGNAGCEQPEDVPPRYEHELDLEVTRIDARTVDKGARTSTDVYVQRNDFSNSRNQTKNEFNQYISTTEGQKADCEAKKAQAESDKEQFEAAKADAEQAKTSAESAKNSCESTEPAEDGTTPDCSGFDSAITDAEARIADAELRIEEAESRIADAEKFIALYDEAIREANDELNYIQSNESQYSSVSTTVKLRYGNSVVGNISVSLTEGEGPKRYTFLSWTLPDDGSIYAQINEDGPYNEFRYQPLANRTEVSLGYNRRVGNVLYSNTSSNNWKRTPIYVASYDTAACPAPNQYFQPSTVEGIVRTVNDNGNMREIKESVTSSFSVRPRTSMRAGFGFNYEIRTEYRNFDNEPGVVSATGTKEVESYYPTIVNHLPYSRGGAAISFDQNGNATYLDEGYAAELETSDPSRTGSEMKEWSLQAVAIEEYSGNIFSIRNNDHLYHPERNSADTLLLTDENNFPIKKWFVDFTQPDGKYEFKVRTYDAGINHLNTCHIGNVDIDGSIVGDPNGNDDYVKRAITPENPFPAGIGWNWRNNNSMITDLNDWYFEWFSDYNEIPLNQYEDTFLLDQSTINEVKEFHQNHSEFDLSNPLLRNIDIAN